MKNLFIGLIGVSVIFAFTSIAFKKFVLPTCSQVADRAMPIMQEVGGTPSCWGVKCRGSCNRLVACSFKKDFTCQLQMKRDPNMKMENYNNKSSIFCCCLELLLFVENKGIA
jgi:hypothetical protein